MNTSHIESETAERIFHALPAQDRAEIVSTGAAFHRLNLEKRRERAQSKVQAFEARYRTTLDQVERAGLPDDADYALHEDYVEWHYWARILARTEESLAALSLLVSAMEPA